MGWGMGAGSVGTAWMTQKDQALPRGRGASVIRAGQVVWDARGYWRVGADQGATILIMFSWGEHHGCIRGDLRSEVEVPLEEGLLLGVLDDGKTDVETGLARDGDVLGHVELDVGNELGVGIGAI